ncbi:hypothetical protein LB565_16275, partial [Mesorhizobium sp. CA14]|uniref:hypothetical protein n=1 Tax=Mesorhizobium sp. CA14 TaxID=2876642 RepID=UPI001CCC685B
MAPVIGKGADIVIDTVAFDVAHGDQLLRVQADVGAFFVISSSSVYCDDRGRTLDEARGAEFPDLPQPMTEAQATVAPGPETYSTRKVALERRLLDGASRPVIILRPGAIHGVGSSHAREWWFVKRMLDGRVNIPLAYRGESLFHTTSATNIARLIDFAARAPTTRILNVADDRCLSVTEIGAAIGGHLDFKGNLVPIDTDAGAYPAPIGSTPWSIPSPFVIDCTAAGCVRQVLQKGRPRGWSCGLAQSELLV